MGLTLWDTIVYGIPNSKTQGLMGRKFRDMGAETTIRTDKGLVKRPSEEKGKVYQIHALQNFAPWNPNQQRPTLMIGCNGRTIYTYLDERFKDELVEE